jgi:predicted  nucleic acid-binding Zn-ribbon protein
MSETPFQAFIDLIQFDQASLSIEQAIKALQQEIETLKKQEIESNHKFDEVKQKVHDARKEVDELELEMKELDQAEKNKKERLETATDYKQYQSFKNEIEALKRKQHEYEEVLLNAWNRLENAQKEFEIIKKDHANKIDMLSKEIEKKMQVISGLQTDINERSEQRIIKEKIVPQEWLEKYAMMRSKVSNPVVPVINGSCSACFYKVTEQDLIQLRRRKLLQCKGCYRFLYSPEYEKETE